MSSAVITGAAMRDGVAWPPDARRRRAAAPAREASPRPRVPGRGAGRRAAAHFRRVILRGLASARLPMVTVRTPLVRLASTFSPSAVSGSEKLRENEPY